MSTNSPEKKFVCQHNNNEESRPDVILPSFKCATCKQEVHDYQGGGMSYPEQLIPKRVPERDVYVLGNPSGCVAATPQLSSSEVVVAARNHSGNPEETDRIRISYNLKQRKYGGPPLNWTGPPPPNGCEVLCANLPQDIYEDELIDLFEDCGTIWAFRLVMDPLTNLNRGYAFVQFTAIEAVQEAVKQLDNLELKETGCLKIFVSVPNLCLFVGNIPELKGEVEAMEKFSKVTDGLAGVIVYSSPDSSQKKTGFCILEYGSRKSAFLAKRRLSTSGVKIFGCNIVVDWADPQEEPENERVKVLCVRNLTQDFTEEKLREAFEAHGPILFVEKVKDYAFVHFEEGDDAVQAMDALNGRTLYGANLSVSLIKSDHAQLD